MDLVLSKMVGGMLQSGVVIVGWTGGMMGSTGGVGGCGVLVTAVVIAIKMAGVCGWALRGWDPCSVAMGSRAAVMIEMSGFGSEGGSGS